MTVTWSDVEAAVADYDNRCDVKSTQLTSIRNEQEQVRTEYVDVSVFVRSSCVRTFFSV